MHMGIDKCIRHGPQIIAANFIRKRRINTRWEKNRYRYYFIAYANIKGSGEPAHPHSLNITYDTLPCEGQG